MKIIISLLSLSFSLLFSSAAVAQWINGQSADVVLGQSSFNTISAGEAPMLNQIGQPVSVAVDPVSGKVFVLDSFYGRIGRWSSVSALQNGSSPEAFVAESQIPPFSDVTREISFSVGGIAIDSSGRLYLSDSQYNRVLRYDSASTRLSRSAPNAVLGQANFNGTLSNRGGTVSANTLSSPRGLWIQGTTLWVADAFNNRVLRFDNVASKANGAPADGVLGQVNFTTGSNAGLSASTMSTPNSVTIDAAGNLYVSEQSNYRVLRFNNAITKPNGAPADGVLGQVDFTSGLPNRGGTVAANAFQSNFGVTSDGNTLWVGDVNRLLRFDAAASKPNGASADGILGQPDFTSSLGATSANRFRGSIASFALAGRLWVCDGLNRRVLRFDNARTKTNGANADGVLGASDFVTRTPISSARTLRAPGGIAFDEINRKLYIADGSNNRVLRFNENAIGTNYASAEAVFGQTNFTDDLPASPPGANTLSNPRSLAVDNSGRLWVLDGGNARIVRYDNAFSKPSGASADGVLGQPDFTTANLWIDTTSTRANTVSQTAFGIAVDNAGNLYFSEGNSNVLARVLRWNNAAQKPNGANADAVLGQADFTSSTPNRGGSANANTLSTPYGLVTDNSGRLWVADRGNHRVLRFDSAASKPNGANADGVLGQPNFTGSSAAISASRLNTPIGLAVDREGSLYVADGRNNRILIFRNAASKAAGAEADFVIGQSNFTENNPAISQNTSPPTQALAIDNRNGKLWAVAGVFLNVNVQNRALRFSASRPLSVERQAGNLPTSFSLSQNYPNPFNPSTTISYQLPTNAQVSLKVYDMLGREIAVLINGRQEKGAYTVSYTPENLSSGVYFYRLQAGTFSATKKMTFVK